MGFRMRQSCKRDIQRAVIELLDEEPLEHITVTQVTKRASVSRTSYYRHYDSLHSVIYDYFDDLADELKERHESVMAQPVDEDLSVSGVPLYYTLLSYRDHGEDLRIILASNLRGYAMERMHGWMRDVMRGAALIVKVVHLSDESLLPKFEEYVAAGLTAVVCDWVDRGCEEEPDQLLRNVLEFHQAFVG